MKMAGNYSNPSAHTQKRLNEVAAGLVAGKKKQDALTDAGYSATNARAMSAAKRTLSQHLDDEGITDGELAKLIREALHCEMPLSFKGELTGDSAPDWKARVRMLELVSELRGHRPGKDFRDNHDQPIAIQINFGGTESTAPLAHEGGMTFTIPTKPPELPDELP